MKYLYLQRKKLTIMVDLVPYFLFIYCLYCTNSYWRYAIKNCTVKSTFYCLIFMLEKCTKCKNIEKYKCFFSFRRAIPHTEIHRRLLLKGIITSHKSALSEVHPLFCIILSLTEENPVIFIGSTYCPRKSLHREQS